MRKGSEMEEQTATAWLEAIYAPRWFRIFSRMSAEKYGAVTDPNDLAEDARQKLANSLARLSERDLTRLLSRSYILVAFKNALVDAFRERYGRAEPRKWLKDLGAIGGRLFDLYCLMRLGIEEILAALRRDSEYAPPCVDFPDLEQQVRAILQEMDRQRECEGHPGVMEPLAGGTDDSADEEPARLDPPTTALGPEARWERERRETLTEILYGSPLTTTLRQRIGEQVTPLGGQPLHLTDEQAFILRCAREGLTEARIGQLLGGMTARQVRYRRDEAIKQLRTLLENLGLRYEDFVA